MHIKAAITSFMEAGFEGMQTHSDRQDWWQSYNACAELLDKHNKGVINLKAFPVTWSWIETLLGDSIEDDIVVIKPAKHLPSPVLDFRPEISERVQKVIQL